MRGEREKRESTAMFLLKSRGAERGIEGGDVKPPVYSRRAPPKRRDGKWKIDFVPLTIERKMSKIKGKGVGVTSGRR